MTAGHDSPSSSSPTASASCTLDSAVIDVDAWDRRLLGLELRCVLRAAAPALV